MTERRGARERERKREVNEGSGTRKARTQRQKCDKREWGKETIQKQRGEKDGVE